MKMQTKHIIQSRQLPKTGQTIEKRAGDDGTYQKGWWKGLLLAANRDRFIGNHPLYPSLVIDRATGLQWAMDWTSWGTNKATPMSWNDAIDYFLGLDYHGFADWRLPNINELRSIVNYGANSPAVYTDYFWNMHSLGVWSGTTKITDDEYALIITFQYGYLTHDRKDLGSYKCMGVRTL